jgi:hypothetical protein
MFKPRIYSNIISLLDPVGNQFHNQVIVNCTVLVVESERHLKLLIPVDKKSGSWTFHMNLVLCTRILPSGTLLKFPVNGRKGPSANFLWKSLISSSSAAPGSPLVVELLLPHH